MRPEDQAKLERAAVRADLALVLFIFLAIAWAWIESYEVEAWQVVHTRRWIEEFHRLNPQIPLPDLDKVMREDE